VSTKSLIEKHFDLGTMYETGGCLDAIKARGRLRRIVFFPDPITGPQRCIWDFGTQMKGQWWQ
jgi:hypothetical protein